MKKLFVILICLLCIIGCSEEKLSYKTITSEEAYQMMSSNEDILIIDVRTPEEYKSGHIEGTINIPYNLIESRISEIEKEKKTTILVYCQSGRRSKEASKALVGLDYSNVYDFGGLNDWNYGIVVD